MRALDPLKHATETLQYFDTLIKVDPFRKSYFEDLRSKFIMENVILENQGNDSEVLDLSSKVR